MHDAIDVPTAIDQFELLYRHPGPYLSAYMQVDGSPADRLDAERPRLLSEGISPAAIDAACSRLRLPNREDAAAQAVIAAADGTTLVEYGLEGPAHDLIVADALPYAAPVLEWHQLRVPHVVATVTGELVELAEFLLGREPRLRPVGNTVEDAAKALHEVADADCALVVIAGDREPSEALAHALVGMLPSTTAVEVVEPAVASNPDRLADATVRLVADHAARRTVSLLREYRYLLTHDEVADGVADALDALSRGAGEVLLVHDDPDDDRRAHFSSTTFTASLERTAPNTESGRLVDVAIRSAVINGLSVHIVPSTADNGPTDDIAVLLRNPGSDPVAR